MQKEKGRLELDISLINDGSADGRTWGLPVIFPIINGCLRSEVHFAKTMARSNIPQSRGKHGVDCGTIVKKMTNKLHFIELRRKSMILCLLHKVTEIIIDANHNVGNASRSKQGMKRQSIAG